MTRNPAAHFWELMQMSTTSIPCTAGGSQSISLNHVSFRLSKEFMASTAKIQFVFLRPALRKTEAVACYRAMIRGWALHVPHWQMFALLQDNPERILLRSYHEIAHRIPGPKNSIFGNRRFFLVTYEPEDASAEFIRSIAPSSTLVVIARPKYAERNPKKLAGADMAIVISETPIQVRDANLFTVETDDAIAPLMRNWVEGWIFGRNSSLVPMFGTSEDLQDLRSRIGPNPPVELGDLALLCRPRARPLASRVTSEIRNEMCAHTDAAYMSLGLHHKYWGLLQNKTMNNDQILSRMLKAGAHARFIERSVPA